MSKNRIKKFREAWEDDEWGTNENQSYKKKDKRRKQRTKSARQEKFSERWYDEDMNLKRKKQQKNEKRG